MVDVVVPAYNERASVADVVRVLRKTPGIGRVLVVDDGSKDDTTACAGRAGAEVLRLLRNRGKGQAMLAGAFHLGTDPVAFCDADLIGLRPEHFAHLIELSPHFDMVCGVRDYGVLGNPLQLTVGPLITGERVIRRWVLDALPDSCWNGYAIETGLNFVCDQHGGAVAMSLMRGVSIRGKTKKVGVVKGLLGQARMFRQIRDTKRALVAGGTCACKTEGAP